jgi:RNA polymerase sigma-70 factor (ECF subfamily)
MHGCKAAIRGGQQLMGAEEIQPNEKAKWPLAPPSSSPGPREEGEAQLAEEARLVQRAMEGDARAFAALYEANLDAVYRYIYRRLESVFEAENLTSETFTRAVDLLAQGRYKSQGKPFAAWLFGIAAKVLQERYRSLKSTPVMEDLHDILEHSELVSGEDDILDSIVQREEYSALWQLVEELPVRERSVIILRHVYELSYAQIAERLGGGEDACKQLHYRALKKLRRKAQGADLLGDVSRGKPGSERSSS